MITFFYTKKANENLPKENENMTRKILRSTKN